MVMVISHKRINFIIIVVIGMTVAILCKINNIWAEEKLFEINKKNLVQMYNSKKAIEVNFYHWNRKTDERGDFIGLAELKEGKLAFDVKNKRLAKILRGDFHTMITIEENGKPANKFVIYKVGTIEHLQSVIKHCKDISCIAEIVNK